jgi:hypothetical protein
VVKQLTRGETLSQAHEIYRGTKDDVGIELAVLNDGAGYRVVLLL